MTAYSDSLLSVTEEGKDGSGCRSYTHSLTGYERRVSSPRVQKGHSTQKDTSNEMVSDANMIPQHRQAPMSSLGKHPGAENNNNFNSKLSTSMIAVGKRKSMAASPRAPLSPRVPHPNENSRLDAAQQVPSSTVENTLPKGQQISADNSLGKSVPLAVPKIEEDTEPRKSPKLTTSKAKRVNSPRGEDNVLPLVNKVIASGGSSPTSSINTKATEERKAKIDPRK